MRQWPATPSHPVETRPRRPSWSLPDRDRHTSQTMTPPLLDPATFNQTCTSCYLACWSSLVERRLIGMIPVQATFVYLKEQLDLLLRTVATLLLCHGISTYRARLCPLLCPSYRFQPSRQGPPWPWVRPWFSEFRPWWEKTKKYLHINSPALPTDKISGRSFPAFYAYRS